LISLPKEKTPRFRKENHQFQHPEIRNFRMETIYLLIKKSAALYQQK